MTRETSRFPQLRFFECGSDNRGTEPWSVKIDSSLPPNDAKALLAITPSDIYSWTGSDVPLTQSSERTEIKTKWFALTARVVALKVEAGGNLHIAPSRGPTIWIEVCK